MARRKGFSWKRASGITNAKRSIARATGIPTTKSGRKRKARRIFTGQTNKKSVGCATLLLSSFLLIATSVILFF